MGYYATGSWDLEFKDADTVHAAANALEEVDRREGTYTVPPAVRTTVEESLGAVGASIARTTSEFNDMDWNVESLAVIGQTHGKMGTWVDNLLDLLAKYATGTIDWRGEDGNLWRDRLYGDGTTKGFRGEVVYPGDSEPVG